MAGNPDNPSNLDLTLLSALKKCRTRYLRADVLHRTGPALGISVPMIVLVMAANLLGLFSGLHLWHIGVILVVGWSAGALIPAWLTRPSLFEVAKRLDQSLELRNRVGSAFEFSSQALSANQSVWRDLAMQDALRTVNIADLRQAVIFGWPKWLTSACVILVAGTIGWWFIPPRTTPPDWLSALNPFSHSENETAADALARMRQQTDQAANLLADANQTVSRLNQKVQANTDDPATQQALENVKDTLARLDKQLTGKESGGGAKDAGSSSASNPSNPPAPSLSQSEDDAASRESMKPQETIAEASKELMQAADKLDHLSAREEAVVDRLRQALSAQPPVEQTTQSEAGNARVRQLSNALKRGDFAAASKWLDQLEKDRDQLTPQQRNSVAKGLDDLAQKLAQQNPQQQEQKTQPPSKAPDNAADQKSSTPPQESKNQNLPGDNAEHQKDQTKSPLTPPNPSAAAPPTSSDSGAPPVPPALPQQQQQQKPAQADKDQSAQPSGPDHQQKDHPQQSESSQPSKPSQSQPQQQKSASPNPSADGAPTSPTSPPQPQKDHSQKTPQDTQQQQQQSAQGKPQEEQSQPGQKTSESAQRSDKGQNSNQDQPQAPAPGAPKQPGTEASQQKSSSQPPQQQPSSQPQQQTQSSQQTQPSQNQTGSSSPKPQQQGLPGQQPSPSASHQDPGDQQAIQEQRQAQHEQQQTNEYSQKQLDQTAKALKQIAKNLSQGTDNPPAPDSRKNTQPEQTEQQQHEPAASPPENNNNKSPDDMPPIEKHEPQPQQEAPTPEQQQQREQQQGGQQQPEHQQQQEQPRSTSSPESNPNSAPSPDKLPAIEDLQKQFDRLSKAPQRQQQREQVSQAMRDKAKEMIEHMTPEQRKKWEDLAKQYAKKNGLIPPPSSPEDSSAQSPDSANTGRGTGGGSPYGNAPHVPAAAPSNGPQFQYTTENVNAATNPNRVGGRTIAEIFNKNSNKGAADTNINRQPMTPGGGDVVVQQAAQAVEKALNEDPIPARYRDLIRRWAEQLHASTTTTTPTGNSNSNGSGH